MLLFHSQFREMSRPSLLGSILLLLIYPYGFFLCVTNNRTAYMKGGIFTSVEVPCLDYLKKALFPLLSGQKARMLDF